MLINNNRTKLSWSEPGMAFRVSFINTIYTLQQELQQELQQMTMYGKILVQISQQLLSKKQISNELGQKSISGQLNKIISKLVDHSLIERSEDELSSSKQRYRITNRGIAFLHLLNNKK